MQKKMRLKMRFDKITTKYGIFDFYSQQRMK